MLASMASAPRVTRCSLGLYWSRDLCSRETGWLIGWLGDVILSRSDSERQRNLMMQDQCPLPVYYSQLFISEFLVAPTHTVLMFSYKHPHPTTVYYFLPPPPPPPMIILGYQIQKNRTLLSLYLSFIFTCLNHFISENSFLIYCVA